MKRFPDGVKCVIADHGRNDRKAAYRDERQK
jgi:hypothetical protein